MFAPIHALAAIHVPAQYLGMGRTKPEHYRVVLETGKIRQLHSEHCTNWPLHTVTVNGARRVVKDCDDLIRDAIDARYKVTRGHYGDEEGQTYCVKFCDETIGFYYALAGAYGAAIQHNKARKESL